MRGTSGHPRSSTRALSRRAVSFAAVVALITPVAIVALEQPAGATAGNITTVAGNGTGGYTGDGIAATSAELNDPVGVASDALGNVIVSELLNNRVRVIAKSASNPGYPLGGCVGSCTWTPGDIYTLAGGGNNASSGVSATSAALGEPFAVAFDAGGNVVIGDDTAGEVRVVAVSASNPGYPLAGCGGPCTWTVGDIFTVAGDGTPGYNGDGISATSAHIDDARGAAVDSGGNLVFSDLDRVRVVAVSASNPGYPLTGCAGVCTWTVGDIFTIAGDGTLNYSGDGGPATSAQLDAFGIAIDGGGDVVVSDFNNDRLRVIALSASNPGYLLAGCGGVCTWTVGDIFTIAGDGTLNYNGDGIASTSAAVDPTGVAVDPQGDVVLSDVAAARIRVIAVAASNPGYPLAGCGGSCTWTVGEIFTVAGNGTQGYGGDNGPATSAQIFDPEGVSVDSQGVLLLVDYSNERIREVVTQSFNVPSPILPVGASISVGQDAVWSVPIENATAAPLTSVTATLHANANGSTPLGFDGALMPGCSPGGGNSEVCNLSNIPAHSTQTFEVFVPTNALSVNTTITGDIDVSATGQTDTSGTLATVTVVSCGSACVKAVARPGVAVESLSGPPTTAQRTKQVITLPADPPGVTQPPVAVTLNTISPAAAPASDRKMCPISGSATRCSSQISVIAGKFTAYVNKVRPVQVQIITLWANTVPAGGLLMQDDIGGPPIQLPKCVASATTHKFNTPCARPQTSTGSAAAHTLTTTNTILFVGTDPHMARRLVTTPNAPTAVRAGSGGTGAATVQWAVPSVTNGKVTGYAITAYIGTAAKKSVSFTSAATKEKVTGLVRGKTYTFKVTARNAHGSSFPSIASKPFKVT